MATPTSPPWCRRPFLIAQAVDISTDGAIVNAFAGFAIGTMAELDLTAIATKGIYLVGTSGSRIQDMETMLAKVEDGTLDTNVSLWAVTGMAGVADGDRCASPTAPPAARSWSTRCCPTSGWCALDELADKLPTVAAAMVDGRWTKAAEAALLASQA